jgi:hypothetical protein
MAGYVLDPRNLLGIQGLMQDWVSTTGAALPVQPYSAGVIRMSANGTIVNARLKGTAELIKLNPSTDYTMGLTVAFSATGTVTYSYALIDGTSGAVVGSSNVQRTTSGRASLAFTTPANNNLYVLLTIATTGLSGTVDLSLASLAVGSTDVIPTATPLPSYSPFDIRVNLIDPTTGLKVRTLMMNEIQFQSALSDVSALSGSINSTLADAAIVNSDYVELSVETTQDGVSWREPSNGRFILMTDEDDDAVLGTDVRVNAVGFGWLLRKMTMNGPVAGSYVNADGNKAFTNASPGTILLGVGNAAKANGEVTAMGFDFTTANDSAGIPWPTSYSLAFSPGIDFYTVLDNLVTQGAVDWYVSGRVLRVFGTGTNNALSNDRSGTVIYRMGKDISSAPKNRTRESMVNRVTVLGDDNLSLVVTTPGAASPWGQLGAVIQQGGLSDAGTMSLLAHGQLDTNGTAQIQYTYGLDLKQSLFFPFWDFTIGDYIAAGFSDGSTQSLRTRSITVQKSKDADVTANLILNTLIQESQIKQAKRQNGITGGAILGGSGKPITTPTASMQTPSAPANFAGGVVAYQDVTGRTKAQVTLTWSAVTTDINGATVAVSGYQVYGHKITPLPVGAEHLVATVNADSTTAVISNYTPGETWVFRVRAVPAEGPRLGPFPASVTLLMAGDTTAPGYPTPFTLTSRAGALSIIWNGKVIVGGTAQNPPPDYARLDVQISTDSSFATAVQSLAGLREAGGIVATDLTYGTIYFVRGRSFDVDGNVSAWSPTQQVTINAIVNTDITDRAIQANDIALGAIQNDLIANGAVNNQKIAVAAVATNKLMVGGTNYIADPQHAEPTINTQRLVGTSGLTITTPTATSTGYITTTSGVGTQYYYCVDSASRFSIPCEQGETYVFDLDNQVISGAARVSAYAYFKYSDGTNTYTTLYTNVTPTGTTLSASFTAPAGALFMCMSVMVDGSVAGVLRLMTPSLRNAVGATIISDGAVNTNKITANAVTAGKIAALAVQAGALQANSVTAGNIVAGSIDTIKLTATAINGMVITGSTIRTAAPGVARGEFNTNGLYFYNAAGGVISYMTPSDIQITGVFRTDAVGMPRMEMLNTIQTGAAGPAHVGTLQFFNNFSFTTQPNLTVYDYDYTGAKGTLIQLSSGQRSGRAMGLLSIYDDQGINYSLINIDTVNASGVKNSLAAFSDWPGQGCTINFNGHGPTTVRGNQGTAEIRLGGINNGGSSINYSSDDDHNFFIGTTTYLAISSVATYVTGNMIFTGPVGNPGNTELITASAGGSLRLFANNSIQLNVGGAGVATVVPTGVQLNTLGTNTAAPNLLVFASTNTIQKSTSLSKYKLFQEPIEPNYAILDLPAITWTDSGAYELNPAVKVRHAGHTAESLRALSDQNGGVFHSLLAFDDDDATVLRGIDYERMLAYVLPVIKDMANKIDGLTNQLAEIKGAA